MSTNALEPPANVIDIGSGHKIQYVTWEGAVAGINYWHLKKDGSWCSGWVIFNGSPWANLFPDKVGWDVVQREPLTLQPSLLCRACGDHGHITAGRWVPD